MTPLEARLVHLANLLVGGTGLVYALFRYAVAPPDEFALVHPGQPVAQHAHVLAAPLLVFVLGLVWQNHAGSGLRLGIATRRRSGTLLVALAAPMVVSGYLLQVAVEPGWRAAWIALHLAASGLWLVAGLAHWLGPRRS